MTAQADLVPVLARPQVRPAPATFADWLRDQDLTQLAMVARAARSTGKPFGRTLRGR